MGLATGLHTGRDSSFGESLKRSDFRSQDSNGTILVVMECCGHIPIRGVMLLSIGSKAALNIIFAEHPGYFVAVFSVKLPSDRVGRV